MTYRYHKGDLFEEYFKVHGISENDLDISLYGDKYENERLAGFKDKLLEIRDSRFLIVGDYDCDGICSTAIIKRLFEHLGINHNYYIPSRAKEGYGLNEDIVNMAKENGFDCIFTVDNGVAAHDAIKVANDDDIKVMILDHHEYQEEPDVYAFIHPELLDKPYSKLSAGGLSYLFSTLFHEDELSLVYGGIAVLADMVGVLGYNRYLIKKAMEILNKGEIYQINLLNESDKYSYNSLSYNVIPKINAVSRMDYNANIVVRYLLADYEDCIKSVASINKVNIERKNITERLVQKAYKEIDRSQDIIIVKGEEYQEGICGLVANRMIYSLNKPVIILNEKEGVLKGSGRSRENFNIYEYLSGIKEIFTSFGGHGQACGISLDLEDYDRLIEYINSTMIEINEPVKDIYETDINSLSYGLCVKLEDLKPFGTDLEEPLLMIRDVNCSNKQVMAGKYPKFYLNDEVSAISFNTSDLDKEFTDMIGHLRKDNYRRNKASFIIEELR